MADLEFNSREQEGMYRLLVLLNSSLQFIMKRLEEIAGNKLLDPRYLKDMAGLTQEVQTTLDETVKRKGAKSPIPEKETPKPQSPEEEKEE
ncbi:MAG: hypothetical protein LAO78_21600 [Acidobacteriia bacterium]|nr:hypothetical protein [Terriglobia bacterium]